MDALAALRLQLEWGADEALDEAPVDRLTARPATAVRPVAPMQPPAPFAAVASPSVRGAETVTTADTLAALRTAIAGFEGCALKATAANLVFAEGDPASGLLLIGEAPSADDDRAGRPFAGAVGAYLDRMLASIGLDRSQLLLTPLIPWRPPGDRPPSPAELGACLPFLHRLIALSRPRRIMLLGPLAGRALAGSATPRRLPRGRWIDLSLPGLPPVPALPSLNPAFVMRTPAARRDAWSDLRSLRRALDSDVSYGTI